MQEDSVEEKKEQDNDQMDTEVCIKTLNNAQIVVASPSSSSHRDEMSGENPPRNSGKLRITYAVHSIQGKRKTMEDKHFAHNFNDSVLSDSSNASETSPEIQSKDSQETVSSQQTQTQIQPQPQSQTQSTNTTDESNTKNNESINSDVNNDALTNTDNMNLPTDSNIKNEDNSNNLSDFNSNNDTSAVSSKAEPACQQTKEFPLDAFFGVYDGHGGSQAADFVAKNIHKLAIKHMKDNSMKEALKLAFQQIEDMFLSVATVRHLPDGTTATIALIKGNRLVVGNVGDSEAVLCRGNEPISLTTIHNPQKNEKEKVRIRECGGRLHHDRLAHPVLNPSFFNIAVSRSIGDIFFKHNDYVKNKPVVLTAEPDFHEIELTPDDKFLVLACDGLFDVMGHREIVDFVLELMEHEKNLQTVAEELVNAAYERGSTDNITVLIVKFE